MSLVIKSGTIITASDTFNADILIDGEKITSLAQETDMDGAEIIDASGKLIMPGGVDPHTHFNLPMFGTVSSDDHYTGLKAAAFGGTTTVLDFVPLDEASIPACVDAWHQRADPLAAVDYGFHMNITRFDDHLAEDFSTLARLGISAAAAENYAKHFDAAVMGPARDAGFGAMRTVVQIGASRLTLLDAGEIAAVAANDPFVGNRGEGVLALCLGVEDFAAAEAYLKGKGIALSVRGAGSGSPVGRLLANNTHGVSLFMSSHN